MAEAALTYVMDDAWADDVFNEWMHDVMGEDMATMFSGDVLLAYHAYRFGKDQGASRFSG